MRACSPYVAMNKEVAVILLAYAGILLSKSDRRCRSLLLSRICGNTPIHPKGDAPIWQFVPHRRGSSGFCHSPAFFQIVTPAYAGIIQIILSQNHSSGRSPANAGMLPTSCNIALWCHLNPATAGMHDPESIEQTGWQNGSRGRGDERQIDFFNKPRGESLPHMRGCIWTFRLDQLLCEMPR